MNIQKLLAGACIAVALILSVVAVNKHSSPAPLVAGSIGGPDTTNEYWNYNGFQEWFRSKPMASATSTLCAIVSPPATSTLMGFYANFGQNFDGSSETFYLATSTSSFATTTNLFTGTIAAGATTTVAWIATTTDTTAQARITPPKSTIVFDVKGKLSYLYAGKCYAEFRAFQ